MTMYRISTSLLQQIPLHTPYLLHTGDSHEEGEKKLFREPRFHLTLNNSVKNTILTAVSCLVESLTVFGQNFFGAS